MYEVLKKMYLKMLKVPPEPPDPSGAPGSLIIFRASPKYLKYRLVMWLIGNVIILSIMPIGLFIASLVALGSDGTVATIFGVLFLLSLVFYLLQITFGYIAIHLDYEMRWYKVTDRSLRIREGLWGVREMNMSFSNIQNISITQGPVQRMLGIKDLKVRTAGGGGIDPQTAEAGNTAHTFSMHLGYFRGVDNAEEIREIMRKRLKALKDDGLSDVSRVEEQIEGLEEENPALLEILNSIKAEAKLFKEIAINQNT